MSHKSELAIIREQQLAGLREATGTPERFVLDFACARHDRAFRVTFARFSPAQRFRCESIVKSESGQATTIERLQGLLRPAEASGSGPRTWTYRVCPAPGARLRRVGRSAPNAKR